jgi:tryptophan synthase alpha chain
MTTQATEPEAATPRRRLAEPSAGGARIEAAIRRRTARHAAALIPFFTAGDPDREGTLARAEVAYEAGADVLELGLPFSDPVADGPVLQAASQRALKAGGGRAATLDLARRIRERYSDLPLVILTYLNPVFQMGFEAFARACVDSGVDGVLIPDLSLEESPPVRSTLHAAGVALLPFAAPTSGIARLRRMADVAEGFVYAVARLGVTGAQETLADSAQRVAGAVRTVTDVPVAIGFGVGSTQAARDAARAADAVIVGSALASNPSDTSRPLPLDGVKKLITAMRSAIDEVSAEDLVAGRTVPDVGREGR